MRTARRRGFAGLAALLLAAAALLGAPASAWADDTVRIHVLPFSYNDAVVVECDGKFGMIDAGEDTIPPARIPAIRCGPGWTRPPASKGRWPAT